MVSNMHRLSMQSGNASTNLNLQDILVSVEEDELNVNSQHDGYYNEGGHDDDDSDDDDESSNSESDGGSSTYDDHDDSGTSETTYHSQKNNGGERNEYRELREFSSAETQQVRKWRLYVLFSILIAGALVSSFTYISITNEVKRDSDREFSLVANAIEDSFKYRMNNFFEANREFSRYITFTAMESDQKFPFVSIPSFEVHAHVTRSKARTEGLLYAPIIRNDFDNWIQFTNQTKHWLEESKIAFDRLEPGFNRSLEQQRQYIPPTIYQFDSNGVRIPWYGDDDDGYESSFNARLYTSPPPYMGDGIFQNENLASHHEFRAISGAAVVLKDIVFSSFIPFDDSVWRVFIEKSNEQEDQPPGHSNEGPHSTAVQPVYDALQNASSYPVGFVFSSISWEEFLVGLAPSGLKGIIAVLGNTCNQSAMYELTSIEPILIENTDSYNLQGQTRFISFIDNYPDAARKHPDNCHVYLELHPTSVFEREHDSKVPVVFTAVVSFLFVVMAVIFFRYDRFLQNRNEKVIMAAARSNEIVSSLFPSNVRARLLAEDNDENETVKKKSEVSKNSLRGFLTGETQQDTEMQDADVYKSKPIADLFPETTVMFGDIVGFTAWSSVREPSQVFTLLETIYHAFDEIAKKRRVFKVETVGDCYVAVCGLPDPRKDHAVNMCRFARDCMFRMWLLTKKLEVMLGPDTGDLSMRIGLHSGPVTAGVLRGERSRFQLFGDTMNTAARIESNGKKSMIHLSQETADLLITAGKSNWVRIRSDKIIAKGKGEMQTYWLELSDKADTNSVAGTVDHAEDCAMFDIPNVSAAIAEKTGIDPGKTERLIDWNVEVLLRLLKQVVARRQKQGRETAGLSGTEELMLQSTRGETVLDEVKEIITLPQFDSCTSTNDEIETIEISPTVSEQLHDYVWNIAFMYRNNPFHNFEHASHVTMSVVKLLSRIVAPAEHHQTEGEVDASTLHDHTYGITSDPLTQFSCVLSALIHDLDHPGVPNAQLVKEKSQLAQVYRNKSVAEQNSVDIAWHLLMDDRYNDLRCQIYTDEVEMRRFRQLVVNSVMATDIVDKELKNLRNARWTTAFSDCNTNECEHDTINRKATIVIEHLIQASDVSHTMQHWHIYRKWNERFFMECYKAYKDGRSETDPSETWYKGEIGFFDFYIIPLAKKLKDCGVFGVSSDEYLNYALTNRAEWEQRGQDVLAEMIEKVNSIWR